MKIKVCGLTDPNQMLFLSDTVKSNASNPSHQNASNTEGYHCKVDFVGINFYSISPRHYKGEALQKLNLGRTKKVGIFVNADTSVVITAIQHHGLDYVQLHGDETPAYCSIIAAHAIIIKAFPHYVLQERAQLLKYKMCELFLFDTASLNYGGSGKKFDWSMLKDYNGPRPYLLAGGINIEDAANLVAFNNSTGFLGVDINSKFEASPGVKDLNKITSFIKKIRND